MGVLTDGTPLSWEEITSVCEVFRSYALSQLVCIYQKFKDRQGDPFFWGDELEFSLIHFDRTNRRVQLLLKAHDLLPRLNQLNQLVQNRNCRIAWHPEACDYMIEGVPSKPYEYTSSYLNTVEANMALRRKQAQKILSEESNCDFVLNICAFPQFGEKKFIYPSITEKNYYQYSTGTLCYSNAIISPHHPRMKSLLNNKRQRRQAEPIVEIPIFEDSATPLPFRDRLFENRTTIRDNHIYLEGVLAGWGCCCLQVTFQAESLIECLHLYDQLVPLTSIMLALSAASPIWRGYLTDIDCRYTVLSQTGDDRNPNERQRATMLSRCSSVPLYVSNEYNHLNDIKVEFDENVVSTLQRHGMPLALARHFGYIFTRDPLVIIKEQMYSTNDLTSYHFENLNSTVWYSLRLKPPSLDSTDLGWRVEFRPMDIQITDFENAALAVFMALITRVILTFDLDLTIPISQVHENMSRAHHRNAVRQEKFFFRFGDETRLMSINEIFNGFEHFPGLIPLVRQYLNEHEHLDNETRLTVEQYLSLISKRANGSLLTDAQWMRQFVLGHRDYKQNSIVSDDIQYDLLWKIAQIANGNEFCPFLFESNMKTRTHLYVD